MAAIATSSKPRANGMHLFRLLPKNGLYYEFWEEYEDDDDDNEKPTIRRILPGNMSTKIMVQLCEKHHQPTKKDFDNAITQLFNNASRVVSQLASEGKTPSGDLDFWRTPKTGTIFEMVSDNTTYRFAVKILEARDRWLERQSAGQGLGEDASKYKCETAKAVDRFNEAVEIASLTSDGLAALLSGGSGAGFLMKSYMVDQFSEDDDTSDEEDSDGDEGMADSTSDGNVGPDSALVACTAHLTLGGESCVGADGAQDTGMGEEADYNAIIAQLAMDDAVRLGKGTM
ncbi:hypothetical protein diail_11170, partial [Diaporthe ilicicola]